jgi:hypothetical protein
MLVRDLLLRRQIPLPFGHPPTIRQCIKYIEKQLEFLSSKVGNIKWNRGVIPLKHLAFEKVNPYSTQSIQELIIGKALSFYNQVGNSVNRF